MKTKKLNVKYCTLNIPVINMFGERFEQLKHMMGFKPLNKNINKLDHSKKIQINRNMMQKIYTQQRLRLID